jgi:hypothetical protein
MQGAGKSIFFQKYCDLFGEHGLYLQDNADLMSRFNAYLLNEKVLVLADEVNLTDKNEARKIKNTITSPFRRSEKKNGILQHLENQINFIFTSNDEQVLTLDIGNNRRYLIVRVSPEHVRDYQYFEELNEAFVGDDCAGLKYFDMALFTHNLSEFDYRNSPITGELVDQVLSSLGPLDNWWIQILKSGVHINNTMVPIVNYLQIKDQNGKIHTEEAVHDKLQFPYWLLKPCSLKILFENYNFQNKNQTTCHFSKFFCWFKQRLPFNESLDISEDRFEMPPLLECRNHASLLYNISSWKSNSPGDLQIPYAVSDAVSLEKMTKKRKNRSDEIQKNKRKKREDAIMRGQITLGVAFSKSKKK